MKTLIALFFSLSLFLLAADFGYGQDLKLKSVKTSEVSLGDRLRLEVQGLKDTEPNFDVTALRLFLNGRQLTESRALITDLGRNLVEFQLARTDADKMAWTELLGAPPLDGVKGNVPVGIGKSGGQQYPYDTGGVLPTVSFKIFNQLIMVIAALFVAVALAGFLWLARNTRIVRNPAPARADVVPAYSLARCQMAFWLFLITAAFLFVWVITGDYKGILTAQSLILIGISGTTALASVEVNRSKELALSARGISVQTPKTWTFLRDILWDENGPALHRYQIFIWTLMLGAVFLNEVYHSLRLPEFDATLLAMMGISGLLYVGFKWPEARNYSEHPMKIAAEKAAAEIAAREASQSPSQ